MNKFAISIRCSVYSGAMFLCFLVFSACDKEVLDHRKVPSTVIEYHYQDNTIRVWTRFGVKIGESFKHSKIEAREGVDYLLENGSKLSFEMGDVTINGNRNKGLKGNYVFSKDDLVRGFIRTFD